MEEPIYKRIYNDLLEKITAGGFGEGTRLPSEKELCEAYKVSRITSKRALALLAEQGYISRCPGKGSFVNTEAVERRFKNSLSSGTIGLIIPDFSDSFGAKLIYGIEESCAALGYQLVLKRSRDRAVEEEKAIKSLAGAAGILLLPVHGEIYNPEILKLVLEKRPLVFVDRKLRGLAAPAVATDNIGAAETAAGHLLELGHRNIAFFSGPIEHISTLEDRYRGFVQAFVKFGLSHKMAYLCEGLSSVWTWPYYSPMGISHDVETAANHLKTHPELSAAFTTEYSMALVVKTAAESLGRRVPEDFSVITFDAPSFISEIPPVSYVYQDEYSIGNRAVEILHRIIGGNGQTVQEDVFIPAKFISGASTAKNNSADNQQARRRIRHKV